MSGGYQIRQACSCPDASNNAFNAFHDASNSLRVVRHDERGLVGVACMAADDTTENWDDDFEFQHAASHPLAAAAHGPLTKDKLNELREWSEPAPWPPSTHRPETENWDDDFQSTAADSPARQRPSRSSPSLPLDASPLSSRRAKRQRPSVAPSEHENWDDDFQDDDPHTSHRSPTWDSSDDELELGLSAAERDDDRTVTSRARHGTFPDPDHSPQPPPVPPIPSLFTSLGDPAPFPRSPTASVFSVPVSGRDSVAGHSYSSTAHLALRPTLSGSSLGHPLLPPSPPTRRPQSRERRRLRKKSRPAHVEPNIYELEDWPTAIVPVTPDRPHQHPHQRSPSRTGPVPPPTSTTSSLDDTHAHTHPPQTPPPPVTPPNAVKSSSSLASRIGSVGKKWHAARKKRTSVGVGDPSSVADEREKTKMGGGVGVSPPISRASWFFRHGGGAGSSASGSASGSREKEREREGGDASSPYHQHHASTSARAKCVRNSMSGGLSLRHETSVDRLFARVAGGGGGGGSGSVSGGGGSGVGGGGEGASWRRPGSRVRRGLPVDLARTVGRSGSGSGSRSGSGRDSPRRPSSMQFFGVKREWDRDREGEGGRAVSYGRMMSGGREGEGEGSSSVSGSVEDVGEFRTPTKEKLKGRASGEFVRDRDRDREAWSGGFVGHVRKLSLQSARGVEYGGGGQHRLRQAHGHGYGHKAKQDSQDANPDDTGDVAVARPSTSTQATAVPPRLPEELSLAFGNGNDTTPKPASRVFRRASVDQANALLPPIELQPPPPSSPPASAGIPSTPLNLTTRRSPSVKSRPSPSPSQALPTSPQSASLGRSTHPPKKDVHGEGNEGEEGMGKGKVVRRNSLGDLKIPARISQAQIGLRRDLGLVREFAASVEQLRELQATHDALVVDVRTLLLETVPSEEPPSKPRATSPTLFGLPAIPRHGRTRSNTNPQAFTSPATSAAMLHRQLSTTYRSIEAKYAMSWECAELLVELGGGPPPPPTTTTSQQAPVTSSSVSLEQSQSTITPSTHKHPEVRRSRERAMTLGADDPKPPTVPVVPPSVPQGAADSDSHAWRASTGRHDLSQRQLMLLRDMLGGGSDYPGTTVRTRISEEALNREWHWGDARSSSVTLPSEAGSSRRDSVLGLPGSSTDHGHAQEAGGLKKRKSTRLGMRGLRDMLKSLRKSVSQNQVKHHQPPLSEDPPRPHPLPRTPASSTSVALTESSMGLPPERDQTGQRRRAKTSAGPESAHLSLREGHPNSPYATSPSTGHHRLSPRRPSLASIFRLGQKSSRKSSSQSASSHELSAHDDRSSGVYTEEEDWDKVESRELPLSSDWVASPPLSMTTSTTLKGMTRNWSPHSNELSLETTSTSPGRALTNGSRSSIWESSSQAASASLPSASSLNVSQSHARTTKLSDVQELVDGQGEHRRRLSKSRRRQSRSSYAPSPSPKRPASRGGGGKTNGGTTTTTESLRSPSSVMSGTSPGYRYLPELEHTAFSESPLSLAMTPENIRPLLENAKEVYARCGDCIEELRQLLAVRTTIVAAAG